jgi:flagellar motor switch protein FliN/FliY
MVNGTIVAKGEIVTIDGRYGIRVVEVATANQRAAGVERR